METAIASPNYKFDSLTSMRGIAASCVVLIHMLAVWSVIFPAMAQWTYFKHFAQHCYLFVDFFFVLSGFVVSHVYGGLFRRGFRFHDFLNFMRARFARIYPLHLVLLMIYVGLAAIGFKQEVENPEWSIAANLFLANGLGFINRPTWNIPSWSISVEFWTYIFFPLLAMTVLAIDRQKAILLGLLSTLIGYAILSVHFGSADVTVGYGFIRCVLGFLAGACIYSIFRGRGDKFPTRFISGAMFLFVPVAMVFVRSPYLDIFAFCGFCILVFCVRKDNSEPHWLHHPKLIWLGDISYSIYLWHTLVMHGFGKVVHALQDRFPSIAAHNIIFFIACLLVFEVLLVFVANLSYLHIEIPARKLLTGRARNPAKSKLATS